MAGTELARCVRDTVIEATFGVRVTANMRDFGEGDGMTGMIADLVSRITDTLRYQMEWAEDSIEPSDALRGVVAVSVVDISNEREIGPVRRLEPAEVEEIDFDMTL